MKKQIRELEKAMKEYKEKFEIANEAEDRFDEDPFNEELEEAFDKAYSEEHKAFEKAARILANLISTDTKTARIMIMKNGDQIIDLVSRVA